MIAQVAVFTAVACAPVIEIAKTNSTLELNLRAIEAFERGPVVLEASITNRGTKPLLVEGLDPDGACRLEFPEGWRFESWQRVWLCHGQRDKIIGRIRPGQTYTSRYYLNRDYRSPYPAGAHEIRAHWQLWTIRLRKVDDDLVAEVPDRLAAQPSKVFTITVSPATPANRWALAARLEAEFDSLPPASIKDADFESPFQEFCDRILHSPHPELLPLYFRALDRTLLTEPAGRVAEHKLAESIFEADPVNAHRLFVNRLLAPHVDYHSSRAFSIWGRPGERAVQIQNSLFTILKPEFLFEPKWWPRWSIFNHLELLADWARETPPYLLPDGELRRLSTAKDPKVRDWVYDDFKHRLGEEWCRTYLKERAQRRTNP
jgi:hypothetical protein